MITCTFIFKVVHGDPTVNRDATWNVNACYLTFLTELELEFELDLDFVILARVVSKQQR